MSAPTVPKEAAPAGGLPASPGLTLAEISDSCRLPLLILFLSAAVWFLVGSLFSLLCSIKFHGPNFLANSAWLTYGRLRPAANNAVLYGGCLQAGLGVGLWLLTQLGQVRLAGGRLVTAGGIFWNLGLTIGIAGILLGDSTGFETLELPSYSVLLLFASYLLIGICALLTFHGRCVRSLAPSQWFLFTAIFWFPWVYSTVELLLLVFPVRGVTQSVLAWWYSANLLVIWLGFVGLAVLFHLIPTLIRRELYSDYLALFAFWMVLFFGGWSGIPNSAPVPAWMPIGSTVATVLLVIPLLAVGLNIYQTLEGKLGLLRSHSALPFLGFGVFGLLAGGIMKIAGALVDTNQLLHFTWYATANIQLYVYGFFAMVIFGAVYFILPQIIGMELQKLKPVRLQFWLSALGILLTAIPLIAAGVMQTLQLSNPNVAFVGISRSSLTFLRVSTVGELLIVLGQTVFLLNLVGWMVQFYRAQARAAYAAAVAPFQIAEGKA